LLLELSGATVAGVCAKTCGAAIALDRSNTAIMGLFMAILKKNAWKGALDRAPV
jgi:hypothetical protein